MWVVGTLDREEEGGDGQDAKKEEKPDQVLNKAEVECDTNSKIVKVTFVGRPTAAMPPCSSSACVPTAIKIVSLHRVGLAEVLFQLENQRR